MRYRFYKDSDSAILEMLVSNSAILEMRFRSVFGKQK